MKIYADIFYLLAYILHYSIGIHMYIVYSIYIYRYTCPRNASWLKIIYIHNINNNSCV